jgi:hypothetical protein
MANGQLDVSTLAQIEGEPGDYLRRDACGYWNALQRDFKADMHFPLTVMEAYRPLSTQRTYFFGRYRKSSTKTGLWYEGSYWVKLAGQAAASIPGLSKHGDGLAVDVNVYSFDSAAYRWLAKNAGRYGFGNAQGRADGEPWHWVFGETRPSTTPAALNTTPIEDDMSYEHWTDEGRKRFFNDMFGGGFRMQNWKGDWVAVIDVIRATEQIAETGKNAAISASDAVTPGIEGVKYDGATYAMAKYGAEQTQAVLRTMGEEPKDLGELVQVDEGELAAELLPKLLLAIDQLPKASVDAIAKATVAQLGRTIIDRPADPSK